MLTVHIQSNLKSIEQLLFALAEILRLKNKTE